MKLPTESKYYRILQNNIAKGSVIYLQNNMITLKMLPEKNDVTIIDENIAESFHDVYVNKDNANEASKEIVSVVLKYLKKWKVLMI